MAKLQLYKDLFDHGIFKMKEIPNTEEAPYECNFNNILSQSSLFDGYSLLAENLVKSKNIEFDKACAVNTAAIPYATNIATSFCKGLLFAVDNSNDRTVKGAIKGISIEGGMKIDDRILLIVTIATPDYFINNLITRITKYGGTVVGVVVMWDSSEGEYIPVLVDKYSVFVVVNINDVCNNLENNNVLGQYTTECVKYYGEKLMKKNIKLFS
jgi:orotate phosphoribosyltransferase